MAAVARLWNAQSEVTSAFFELTQAAEDARPLEQGAALRIQTKWRSYATRRNLRWLSGKTLVIQRWYRGYLGRLRFKLARKVADHNLRVRFFDIMATEIQRSFRGYWSRKHIHSFYARKAYLEAVMERTAALRGEMEGGFARQQAEDELRAAMEAQDRFVRTIDGLHHLVSTDCCPGVYNSPFASVAGGLPSVGGVTVEEHLRATRHGRMPSRSQRLGPQSREATRQGKQAPAVRLSVQAGSPYGEELELQLQQKHLEMSKRTSTKPFISTVKKSGVMPPATLLAGEPFPDTSAKRGLAPHVVEEMSRRVTTSPYYTSWHQMETFEELPEHI
mmetsp:Transcript_63599/g.201131  ORF Transcript_63599/g.201131 Transcript_63599/m.201131 type:complete len:332 (+) Transcript_63599:86-1081(+)